MDRSFVDMSPVLKGLLLTFILLMNVNAQGPDVLCVPKARVRKNTVLNAVINQHLTLSCPVTYCEEIPTISWKKINELNQWTQVQKISQITVTQEKSTSGLKEVVAKLSFKSISQDDDGLYRCVLSGSNSSSESHNINVSVLDVYNETKDGNNSTDSAGHETSNQTQNWLPYIFICSGIFGLVTVVMLISFLSMNGCPCSRKVNEDRNQCAVSPSPCTSTQQGKSIAEDKPKQQNHVVFPLEPSDPDSNSFGSQSESQQIVYATLEHLTPKEPSVLNHLSREHYTEYAPIRVS